MSEKYSRLRLEGAVQLPEAQWRTVPERIADQILAVVAVGILQPGQRLPSERQLSANLGVSRTSVRLALNRLAAIGVVESRRGRHGGTFVGGWQHSPGATERVRRTLEPVRAELEAMFDYRSLIEQLIARTAAERHTRTDAEAMRAAVSDYRRARTADAAHAADRALHSAVAEATGNPHLGTLSAELVARANLGFAHEPYSPRLHREATQQHSALVAAITARDAEEAARIAGEHFQRTTGNAWRSALSRRSGTTENPA